MLKGHSKTSGRATAPEPRALPPPSAPRPPLPVPALSGRDRVTVGPGWAGAPLPTAAHQQRAPPHRAGVARLGLWTRVSVGPVGEGQQGPAGPTCLTPAWLGTFCCTGWSADNSGGTRRVTPVSPNGSNVLPSAVPRRRRGVLWAASQVLRTPEGTDIYRNSVF